MIKKKAVVLVSGGLDSATALAIAQKEGYEIHALTFRYGQRHEIEVSAASRVVAARDVLHHIIVNIDLRVFGGSALTADIAVPKGRQVQEISQGIPVTYVPARNTIFLSFAVGLTEILESNDIFIGVNALDYSGYPDCRPEYIEAFQRMARLATKRSVETGQQLRIHTPLITLTKAQIIRRGVELGVDYALTLSCYDPSPALEACGECDACILRQKGFREAGLQDPALYQRHA